MSERTPSENSAKTKAVSVENVSLDALLAGVLQQMASVVALTEALERSLGGSICDCQEINPELIQSLQSADFIRQSVRDIRSILVEVAPRLSWRDGIALSLSELRQTVDMWSSLERDDPDPRPGNHAEQEEIWF